MAYKLSTYFPTDSTPTLTLGEKKARGSYGLEKDGRCGRCWSERELLSVTDVETGIAMEE
jgi:hypothetical protein